MYSNQYVHTYFNNASSHSWKVQNGVRQGSLISPLLFNFYINELLDHVSKTDSGCFLDSFRHNTQGYADDLSLIAPSVKGLQQLLIGCY